MDVASLRARSDGILETLLQPFDHRRYGAPRAPSIEDCSGFPLLGPIRAYESEWRCLGAPFDPEIVRCRRRDTVASMTSGARLRIRPARTDADLTAWNHVRRVVLPDEPL